MTRLPNILDTFGSSDKWSWAGLQSTIENSTFPPYNLFGKNEEDGTSEYLIEIALAGYQPDDVEVIIIPDVNSSYNKLSIKTIEGYSAKDNIS